MTGLGVYDLMVAKPVLTAEDLAVALRGAAPSTDDDVTVLRDGRRIDSREAALAWLEDLANERVASR
jgi:hypothetical protein